MNFRIVFMGTPRFAVPSLEALIGAGCSIEAVVTQPDRPTGRHQIPTPSPVKLTALSYGIPVLQPEKVRTEEFETALKALSPDLLVTAAYGRILPAGVLAVPRIAPLNVHASLLPKYRGASPIQRCLMDGAERTGVTVMRMDEGMDTGDVLLQRSLEIPDDIDAEVLGDRLARLGAVALLEALDRIASGSEVYVPQDASLATEVRPLDREDGRIDWTWTARRVHDLIRGTRPWPGAYTTLDGIRIKILRAQLPAAVPGAPPPVLDFTTAVPPGAFIGPTASGFIVACADEPLEILELQPESGKRMAARDFGQNLRPGARFGT
jgi:methionyl-tRNA formyltransferase